MSQQSKRKRRARRFIGGLVFAYVAVTALYAWECWPTRAFVAPASYSFAMVNIKASTVEATLETTPPADVPHAFASAPTPPASPVPEPGTLMLLAPAIFMLAKRGKRTTG